MFGMFSRRQQSERSAVEAAGGSREKRAYVKAMFSDIAPSYDRLNHLLSFNIDRRWRRRAIDAMQWKENAAGRFLDLCAGTLDVAAELSRQPAFDGVVVAADFAEPMLRAGRGKGRPDRIHPVVADAMTLPLADTSCDGAIAAFGVRNLADLETGLREMLRVMRPGARCVILEFSTPRSRLARTAYHLYFHRILPMIGGWVSGNGAAYRYLPDSVAHFPAPAELAGRMRAAGFLDVQWRSLTLGIATLHVGTRSRSPA